MFFRRLKTVLLVTAVTIIAVASPTEAQDESLFSDVAPGHQNYTAIKYLKETGIIEGYEDGSYRPLKEINRAEALKILTVAFPKNANPAATEDSTTETPTAENASTETATAEGSMTQDSNAEDSIILPFADIEAKDWFFPFIADAYQNNIIDGYPDGLFYPGKTINKAEALKIALLQEGYELPVEISERPYSDVPVDIWFAPYAAVSAKRTLFLRNRENGGLDPGQNLNRGTFAELIYRMKTSQNDSLFARATWYGNEFSNWGTASGEAFDPDGFTAAHKTLPFGTEIEVTNMANGKKVTVRINDRGPYAQGMDLDLSRAAFEKVASLGTGIICVEYREKSNLSEYAF